MISTTDRLEVNKHNFILVVFEEKYCQHIFFCFCISFCSSFWLVNFSLRNKVKMVAIKASIILKIRRQNPLRIISHQRIGNPRTQGSLACSDSWGRKESDTTERLNWTELNWILISQTPLTWASFEVDFYGWVMLGCPGNMWSMPKGVNTGSLSWLDLIMQKKYNIKNADQ